MNCLHGKPAVYSTTGNGMFWFCGQNPTCNFICAENECYMYEKAITAWRCTEQPHPRCHKHGKLAWMCVVKDLMKESYGRPFFVCGEKTKPSPFWMWGDVHPIAKPEWCHGLPCVIRKVKKEGLNKDRLFFCCPNDKESTCPFFEWAPDEQVGF
jgi:ssDNA-binding Zn-finger/Zn-ribbon topoisomerase 1